LPPLLADAGQLKCRNVRPDPGAAVAGALAAAALQLISRPTEALAAKLPPRRPDAIAEIADPVTAQEVLSRQVIGVRATATCRYAGSCSHSGHCATLELFVRRILLGQALAALFFFRLNTDLKASAAALDPGGDVFHGYGRELKQGMVRDRLVGS
jgi:hypothetical protein